MNDPAVSVYIEYYNILPNNKSDVGIVMNFFMCESEVKCKSFVFKIRYSSNYIISLSFSITIRYMGRTNFHEVILNPRVRGTTVIKPRKLSITTVDPNAIIDSRRP